VRAVLAEATAAVATGRVVAVASGYAGGTGKSTCAVNLAAWFAHPVGPGVRTALVDLGRGRGSLRALLDPARPPEPSILALADHAGRGEPARGALEGVLRVGAPGPLARYRVSVLFGAGSYDREHEVTPDLVQAAVAGLRAGHGAVVLDLPSDVTDAALAALRSATDVLWLLRADLQDVDRHADILGLLRRRAGLDLGRCVGLVTMVPPGRPPAFRARDLEDALGIRVLPVCLPYDPRVAAAPPGWLAVLEDPAGPYAAALRRAAAALWPELARRPRPPVRRPWSRRRSGGGRVA
jgi:MinD-like ATPase involved in chromosome partitioning or flagellar assembly